MTTAVNISKTPMAPYMGILNSMDNNEKEDEDFLAEKLAGMTFSHRIERLFEKRKEIAKNIDLSDERTRHILGI
jgi:hypothetical protein